MKNLNTILVICLCFTFLSCDNSTKRKSSPKTAKPNNKSNEISINNLGVFEVKPETKPNQRKLKKIIGFIKICDIQIGYEDTIVLRNTIEYHLNNGIIYIKEFYPNRKLKSESYWVDNIIPVYQMKIYNQNGQLKKIIDKSIGKYDLCYILNKIKSTLQNKDVEISLSNMNDYNDRKTWSVTYNHIDNEFSSSCDGINYDSRTGFTTSGGFSISAQPANTPPTTDQLPTFNGNIKTFEKYVANSIWIPNDSLVNAEVIVTYNVDTYGIVGNFQTHGATNYLNQKVLEIVKKMPNWIAAKDHNTYGACNSEDKDSGKYYFGFSVYFRRFE